MKKLFSLLYLIASISPLFGQIYNQTSPLQVYSAPSGGAFGNILFQGAPPQPIGPATLTYYYRGDLDFPSSNEFFDLLDENSNFIAQSLSASQCNPQFDSLVLTIPAADIAQWASNGQIGFSFLAGSGVNGASLCTDPSGAFVKIRYQYQTGGNFCPGPFGLNVIVGPISTLSSLSDNLLCGILTYPDTYGVIENIETHIKTIQSKKGKAIVVADLLSLTLLKAPGEMNADIVVGNSQRFGVPMGYGGPHAAFFATKDEYKRAMPGRIIGVSVDRKNNQALRMAFVVLDYFSYQQKLQ